MNSALEQGQNIHQKSCIASTHPDTKLQQELCSNKTFFLNKKSESGRNFTIHLYQSKIEEEDEMEYEDEPDICHQTNIRLISKQINHRLASFASTFQQVGNMAANKLHFTSKVDRIEIDRRNMMSLCQLSYSLSCYHLSKLSRAILIDQSIKKHIRQYVNKIEEDISQKMQKRQMRQDTRLNIYLQRTQSQALDQCLREFRILINKKPSNIRKNKVKALYSQQSERLKLEQNSSE